MNEIEDYAPTILRIGLGALFLIPGIQKLLGMLGEGHGIAQLLGTTGAWILLLVEIVFGLALLIGWNVEYSVMPLIVVMIGAIVLTVIPGMQSGDSTAVDMLFHLLAVLGLVSLSFSGAGAYSIDE